MNEKTERRHNAGQPRELWLTDGKRRTKMMASLAAIKIQNMRIEERVNKIRGQIRTEETKFRVDKTKNNSDGCLGEMTGSGEKKKRKKEIRKKEEKTDKFNISRIVSRIREIISKKITLTTKKKEYEILLDINHHLLKPQNW